MARRQNTKGKASAAKSRVASRKAPTTPGRLSRITISVSPEVADLARRTATEAGVSLSELFTRMVRNGSSGEVLDLELLGPNTRALVGILGNLQESSAEQIRDRVLKEKYAL